MKAKVVFIAILAIIFLMACTEKDDPKPAPVAVFSASKTNIEIGEMINFTDQSQNNPNSFSWHFIGGTPEYSSEQNPNVTYDAVGEYAVTLTVSSDNGQNTVTKQNYIKVVDSRVKIFGHISGVTSSITLMDLAAMSLSDVLISGGVCTMTGAWSYEIMLDKSLLGQTGKLESSFSTATGGGHVSSPIMTFQKVNEVNLTYTGSGK